MLLDTPVDLRCASGGACREILHKAIVREVSEFLVLGVQRVVERGDALLDGELAHVPLKQDLKGVFS
jgi:hypothetical protein